MKVTILVCDRCGGEMREDEVEGNKLDLSLKYEDPDQSKLLPLRRRERIELCPGCRDAFAEWLGDRRQLIDGLRTNGTGEAEHTAEAAEATA